MGFTPTIMEPFRHQVGGHVGLLCVDRFHVCKPFERREASFYHRMPSSIASYAPCFCGELEMAMGGNEFSKYSSEEEKMDGKENARRFACTRCRQPGDFYDDLPTSSSSSVGVLRELNPWVLECQQRQAAASSLTKKQFLVMENLVARFRCPCIIDLKMGTRHYGDDASPEKVAMHRQRAASTTSGQYGTRICGMQYFDEFTGQYIYLDKYYGRSLDFTGLRTTIGRFLLDGQRCSRVALARAFLRRLQALSQTISKMDGLRLYSSSLLLIYDGASPAPLTDGDADQAVEVRMVDFAHSTFPAFLDDPRHRGVDTGYLTGLATLIGAIKETVVVDRPA